MDEYFKLLIDQIKSPPAKTFFTKSRTFTDTMISIDKIIKGENVNDWLGKTVLVSFNFSNV